MTIQTHRPAPATRAARGMLALLVVTCVNGAGAAPTAPVVVAGQATFSQQGNVFSITNAPNTVINWKSFSVDAGEVTRFIQQNADSAVLNRITGQDPSKILGALQSNGHVFLINPNGIMFGKDARVDVNGLTASTLELGNADFLAGKNSFKAAKHAGAIVNQGQITTPAGGHVFLIAADVRNAGVITSPQGQVVLAAGHSVQLVDSANPDLHVVIAAPSDQAINLGQIIAQGGRIGIYGAMVSQRGVVNADSAQVGVNGKIVFKASRDAMLEAGSVTSATGAGSGGQITVEGKRVGMVGDARIDASGNSGGGTVLLGGGYQGKNPLVGNAQQTLMGKDASIRADAIHTGQGGTVVLWGDHSTRAMGQISAQGGATSGNGGLVETSGHQLEVNGIRVNAGARNGAAGTWLLDPFDIDVTNSGTQVLSNVDQFADGGTGSAQVHPNTINSVSAGTNVVLQATHDVTITNAISPNLGSGGSLTIDAGNNINIDASISTSGGALILAANYPGFASGSGKVTIMPSAAINTAGGNVSISAVSGDYGGAIATGGGNIGITNTSFAKFANNVTTGNGSLSVSGSLIDLGGIGTLFSSGSGNMLLRATSGFSLGSTWTVSSQGNIDVISNSASLLGSFGGIGGIRPTLSFSPFTLGYGIDVTSSGTGGTLILDPVRLKTFNVESLVIGSNTTGAINVSTAYSGGLARFLTLTGQGNIGVTSGVTLPAGIGSALLLAIDSSTTGALTLSAPVAADSVVLSASSMTLGAPINGTGTASKIKITPNVTSGQIRLGGGALDGNGVLALDNTELANLHAINVQIGGNPGQAGAVQVTPAGASFSGLTPASNVLISASGANLTLNGNLVTPGSLSLVGNDLQTAAAVSASASAIQLISTLGIGTKPAPFNTQTGALSATVTRAGGVSPIVISNVGTLTLGNVHQDDATNTGSISVLNAGGMTLSTGASVVTNGGGSVSLKTLSPLTINGDVMTDGGSIGLEAGTGGLMTIGPAAHVTSNTGNIGLIAGDIINNGIVSTGTGAISIAATTVTGGGSFTAGAGVTGLPGPPPTAAAPPTVSECVADPALPNCTVIVKAAFDACLLVPTGPDCALVLPTLSACTANSNLPGCSVVLPSLQSCIGDKSIVGCSAVLPPIKTCIGDKAILGCSVVLPSIQACIGDKSILGCSVVLPALQACIGDKSILGCAVVLPSVPVCVGDKSIAGCSVVLPSLDACILKPGTQGCSVVLPTIKVCIANPQTAGCTVVLPSLTQCIANKSLLGCVVVLPTLPQCIANAGLAGCAVVLPTLAQCVADSGLAGCSVVLPSLTQCIANPQLGGCSVVLPTLAQCIASPSLQGCSVVLPSVSACVADPKLLGCQVVTPPLQPRPGSSVVLAIKQTITTLDTSTHSVLQNDKKDDKGAQFVKQQGEKIENRPKTYCN